MLIPSAFLGRLRLLASLSRRVNANSQLIKQIFFNDYKLIKKGEC